MAARNHLMLTHFYNTPYTLLGSEWNIPGFIGSSFGTGPNSSISPVDSNYVYFAATMVLDSPRRTYIRTWRSIDGGLTFTFRSEWQVAEMFPDLFPVVIADPSVRDTVHIILHKGDYASGDRGWWRSTDGCGSFSHTATFSPVTGYEMGPLLWGVSICLSDSSYAAYYNEDDSTIYVSSDNAQTFSAAAVQAGLYSIHIKANDHLECFAAQNAVNGIVYHSSDFFSTLGSVSVGAEAPDYGVFQSLSDGKVICIGINSGGTDIWIWNGTTFDCYQEVFGRSGEGLHFFWIAVSKNKNDFYVVFGLPARREIWRSEDGIEWHEVFCQPVPQNIWGITIGDASILAGYMSEVT